MKLTQKLVASLYTHDKYTKKEIKEPIISFICVCMYNLGKITKKVKDLHNKKFKPLKKLGTSKGRRPPSTAHGLTGPWGWCECHCDKQICDGER